MSQIRRFKVEVHVFSVRYEAKFLHMM